MFCPKMYVRRGLSSSNIRCWNKLNVSNFLFPRLDTPCTVRCARSKFKRGGLGGFEPPATKLNSQQAYADGAFFGTEDTAQRV